MEATVNRAGLWGHSSNSLLEMSPICSLASRWLVAGRSSDYDGWRAQSVSGGCVCVSLCVRLQGADLYMVATEERADHIRVPT